MTVWYALCEALPIEMLQWDFMKNALLALLLMAPLFGILSTMIVTGHMSFFSDALGHSAFTGIAIGSLFGIAAPTWAAVLFSVVFALGILVSTMGGGSFSKYNKYLIGDVLSITPGEIGFLALVLAAVLVFWCLYANRLTLTAVHPQLASSRGIPVNLSQTLFTVTIAVVVTLSISSMGLLILNSLLVLPGAASRNLARNQMQYHLLAVLFALVSGILGLVVSYCFGCSAGAAISLILTLLFALTYFFRGRSA